MNFNRWFVTLFLLASTVCLFADETAELRKTLATQKGAKRIETLRKLYDLSQETDDVPYQLKCINELIDANHNYGIPREEGEAMVMKMTLLYNVDLTDSLYEQAPHVLEFLRNIKEWTYYYETWGILVDAYNFGGMTNTGLKEAMAMYDDSKSRNDHYGMGMAYYSMGNVYANMYNDDEAAASYKKSIELLTGLKPLPLQLSDIYAYYCDVLENLGDYVTLRRITEQWRLFLDQYYAENPEKGSNSEASNRWAYYYLACAQAAIGLNEYDKATDMLRQVNTRTNSEESFLYMMWLYYRSELCRRQGFFEEALVLNNQRMRLMMDSDDKSVLIQTRQQRAGLMEQLGRYQEAAQLYHEMYSLNDSINTHDVKQQLTEMNARFHVGELELEKQRAQYRNTLVIVGIIIIALVVFILFRYIAAKRLKAAHNKLEDAHQQLLTAYDQLEETTTAKERIESDLRIARDIQMGMVPRVFPPFPERTDIDLFGSITPAKAVGGDLYDFFILNEKLYFCLGDVSGKGVPASLFMAVAVNMFRVASKQQLPPAEIATRLNGVLADHNENMMFVTMFIGVADLKTGRLEFCNAGHNPPVIKDKEGHARFLDMLPNAPLGFWPDLEYQGESVEDISMMPFLVYSDGLNEAEDADKQQFGDEHLLELMEQLDFESAEQTIGMLNVEVEKHVKGAEQSDDLTMLCLRIQGNQQ